MLLFIVKFNKITNNAPLPRRRNRGKISLRICLILSAFLHPFTKSYKKQSIFSPLYYTKESHLLNNERKIALANHNSHANRNNKILFSVEEILMNVRILYSPNKKTYA